MNKTNILYVVFTILGSIILLFIIAPIIGMFIQTTPYELFESAKESEVQQSIWLTIWTSVVATLIFSVGAIPLAYLIAKNNFPLKKVVLGVINIPVIIPHSAAGIALLGVISRDTMVGKMAENIGLSFVNHPAGIIIAMAFVSIPYLLNSAITGFSLVPDKLEKVAMTLGASKTKVFFSVSLPLAVKNVVSGLIMMWGRGLSEFGAVVIIAYHPMITPVMIFERFNSYGLSYTRPVTVLFIIICLLIFILMNVISKKQRDA